MTTTEEVIRRRPLRATDAADYVYNDRSEATVKRLKRLEAAGQVRSVRVGGRGHRWFSTVELDGLMAAANDDTGTVDT